MSCVLVIPATTPPLFRGRKVSTQSPILHDLQAAAESKTGNKLILPVGTLGSVFWFLRHDTDLFCSNRYVPAQHMNTQ